MTLTVAFTGPSQPAGHSARLSRLAPVTLNHQLCKDSKQDTETLWRKGQEPGEYRGPIPSLPVLSFMDHVTSSTVSCLDFPTCIWGWRRTYSTKLLCLCEMVPSN